MAPPGQDQPGDQPVDDGVGQVDREVPLFRRPLGVVEDEKDQAGEGQPQRQHEYAEGGDGMPVAASDATVTGVRTVRQLVRTDLTLPTHREIFPE
jgi:hypothetical protein